MTASFVLQNPTIEFIVDGNVIKTENTYPKLTLSNDKEHLIGVQVSHPIQNAEDADVKVKFEYKWTDVWKGGSEGPRMKEPGFEELKNALYFDCIVYTSFALFACPYKLFNSDMTAARQFLFPF